ncbi:hypothetical protein NMY22_g9845 [Coprinellus aureogranulatus]|nr:hypothetical protein NMY22_g9845 [Coprinellus aureogranulatus]
MTNKGSRPGTRSSKRNNKQPPSNVGLPSRNPKKKRQARDTSPIEDFVEGEGSPPPQQGQDAPSASSTRQAPSVSAPGPKPFVEIPVYRGQSTHVPMSSVSAAQFKPSASAKPTERVTKPFEKDSGKMQQLEFQPDLGPLIAQADANSQATFGHIQQLGKKVSSSIFGSEDPVTPRASAFQSVSKSRCVSLLLTFLSLVDEVSAELNKGPHPLWMSNTANLRGNLHAKTLACPPLNIARALPPLNHRRLPQCRGRRSRSQDSQRRGETPSDVLEEG